MSWISYEEGGATVVVSLPPGADPDAAAATIVPIGTPYLKHKTAPALPVPERGLPALTPPQWGFLRRRDGGRMNAVIEAAKAIMPPGDLADMFAEIVDASPSINVETVLALTARVRALAPLLDVPTDAEIRDAWALAQNATPERLLAALDTL